MKGIAVVMMAVLGLCAGCLHVTEIASPPERTEHDAGEYDLHYEPHMLPDPGPGTRPGIARGPASHQTSCIEDGWIVIYRYVDYVHRRCNRLEHDPVIQRGRPPMLRIQQDRWKSERLAVSYDERLRDHIKKKHDRQLPMKRSESTSTLKHQASAPLKARA